MADQTPSASALLPSDAAQSTTTGAAAALAGVGLRHIDHVGVAVPDLDAAIELYERVFGMRCVHVEENAEQGVREAMMALSADPQASQIQLLAPLSPTSTIARFLDRSGPGLQQVAYAVSDIEATSAELRSRGVRLLYGEPRRGTSGRRVNFVHPRDAGGVLVELIESATPA